MLVRKIVDGYKVVPPREVKTYKSNENEKSDSTFLINYL